MKIQEITVTSEDFASLLQVSRRTTETWKREGLPHFKRGIPLFEGVRWWRAERFREMDELRGARTRREVAKAKIAELDAKEREKFLIPYSDSVAWVSQLVAEAKAGFMGLPRRMGPVLSVISDEKECELELRVAIWAILRQLAEGGKKRVRR